MPAPFRSSARFEVRARLGAGGMGVVYEAYDRERRQRVALKTLRALGGDALLRFKNEFRALQGVRHPNLVHLGDLVEEEGHWFYTMELVQGIDLLTHVRRGGECDVAKLRPALAQLADGLYALHAAGKVHRDIKPSNVLVDGDGRVVLLDFGLATSTDPGDSLASQEGHVVGTAAFMAPEQAASRSVGPEADWYSVGVILYQALTGELPFVGNPLHIMIEKQTRVPPTPRSIAPSAPEDLSALAADLMRIDPAQRPGAIEIKRRLGASVDFAAATPAARAPAPTASSGFVGRAEELARLEHAFTQACEGEAVTVIVRGESGVGKTALAKQFTDTLLAAGRIDGVLHGRCHERELVHYKAFDGVVDSLSKFLVRLPRADAAALLPTQVELLAEVFPVLRRVESVAQALRPRRRALDPQELRTRVFAAMRELFVRLAARHRVVVVVDDLQWADFDSLALLAEVVRQPDGPALLFVATMRSEFPKDHPVVRALAQLDVSTIDLAGLPRDHARQLAESLAGGDSSIDPGEIADEARGHPLFVAELVRHALLRDGRGPVPERLEQALSARVDRLDAEARALLELVAVAGAPVLREVLVRAASLELDVVARRLDEGVTAHLLRATGGRATDAVEPFHDRVRDVVISKLATERRRALHERLAIALAAAGSADPEALAVHWRGAGDQGRAALHLVDAADQAAEALAFDRAARLYRDALGLLDGDGGGAPVALMIKLADALAAAGRSAEAARVYLAVARRSDVADDVELRLRAAEQLLRCGHFDEGLTALRDVLSVLGIGFPSSRRLTLASLVWRRMRLAMRGRRFRARDASQVPPLDLFRIDACFTASAMLGMVDTLPAADFQTRQLLFALRAGEPWRLSRALGTEASFACVAGTTGRPRAERLLAQASELAERLKDDRARGFVLLNRGICAILCGDWRAAHEVCEEAEAILRDRCAGVGWEVATAQFMGLNGLMQMGELAQVSARMPVILRAAHDRGDLYAVTQLRTWLSHMLHLGGDDPSGATHAVRSAMERWSHQGFQLQHWQSLHAYVNIALYAGDESRAWKLIDDQWPALERSGLRRIQLIRVMAWYTRGRAALSTGRLDLAERDARSLASERATWALPLADLLAAGVASRRRDRERALALWRAAAAAFDRCAMRLHAQAARRQSGDDIDATDAWMRTQEIESPAKMASMLAPA